jgi:hypothetical protein
MNIRQAGAAGVVCGDAGDVLALSSSKFVRRLGRSAAAGGLLARAVHDLGFIHIAAMRGGLTVKFVPALVAPLAAIAAFYEIARAEPERLVLIHYAEDERFEIFRDIATGLKRFEALLEEAHNPISQPLFKAMPLSPGRLADIAHGRFVDLLENWRERGGRWDAAHYGVLKALGLLDTTLIVRSPAGSSRALREFRGSFQNCKEAQDWPVGRDIEDQPDRRFGEWVAASYRHAMASQAPLVEAVDVAITASSRRQTSRFRYDRIVLPWQTDAGDHVAVGSLVLHHPPS